MKFQDTARLGSPEWKLSKGFTCQQARVYGSFLPSSAPKKANDNTAEAEAWAPGKGPAISFVAVLGGGFCSSSLNQTQSEIH